MALAGKPQVHAAFDRSDGPEGRERCYAYIVCSESGYWVILRSVWQLQAGCQPAPQKLIDGPGAAGFPASSCVATSTYSVFASKLAPLQSGPRGGGPSSLIPV